MSVDRKRKKRRYDHPGLIENFLSDTSQKTMTIKLYPREIRRLERQFPGISIEQDSQFNSTDLWLCIINKQNN